MDISVTRVFEEKKLRQKVSIFIPSAHETNAASAEIAQLKRKGLASQCKAQEKYKERLDLGLTWLK